jgi:hypothetical protein
VTKYANGQDIVDVSIDKIVRVLDASVIVEKDGEERFIGKKAIDNLEEVEEAFERKTLCDLQVPKWLAKQNGWPEGDD